MRGQAAVMDSMMFLLIASGAATLLLYVSSIYGSSTNQQIIAMYNYEFGSDALASLHYAKDADGKYFWKELKTKLADSETATKTYLNDKVAALWQKLKDASPSQCPFLCFETASGQTRFCYPEKCTGATGLDIVADPLASTRPAYSASVNLKDGNGITWSAILKLFY